MVISMFGYCTHIMYSVLLNRPSYVIAVILAAIVCVISSATPCFRAATLLVFVISNHTTKIITMCGHPIYIAVYYH